MSGKGGSGMAAAAVLKALGEPKAWHGRPRKWREAMAAFPRGPLPFLDKGRIAAKCRASGIAADRAPLLAAVADEIARDPALRAFAWYMHWRVFMAPRTGVSWGGPSLGKRLGKRAGLFYLLLSLDFAAALRRYHVKLGYPRAVTVETLQEIASYEAMHVAGYGVPGMYSGMYSWLSSYLVAPFVRLGRFEYQMHGYGGGVRVFRRRADGAVLALAGGGERVDAEGLLAGDRKVRDGGWRTKFRAGRSAFTGNPVDPAGRILRRRARLPRPAWRKVLDAGDNVLDLHIPYGGGMDWDRIRDSFRRAAVFFRRYHRRTPVRAVVVHTWFMDPRVPEVLGPDCNPAKFQRACYLYPGWPYPDGLWFVFLKSVESTPPEKLPGKTSVQRALRAFLKRGGRWNSGAMFVLAEDMEDMREMRYRQGFESTGWGVRLR